MGTRLPQSKWDFFSSNQERKEDKNLSLNRFIHFPVLCCMNPTVYDVVIRSMLLHFLSPAYFFRPCSIRLYLSPSSSVSPLAFIASPRQRARITPSSMAEQPPCPISGVIGWSASPATHTLSFAMFAHKSSHGGRYLSRDITMLSRSVVSTTLLMFSGKSLILFSTNSLMFSGLVSSSNQAQGKESVTAEEDIRKSSVYLIQYQCGLGTSRQCCGHRG